MTFSIAARSADGQEWGVAVASKFLGVGSAVPAARAGLGAVATQALANTGFKRAGLGLLDQGRTAQQTLDELLAGDDGREHRQVGVVDREGNAATFTGSECYAWAGGVTGDGVAIQGNILAGAQVVESMHRTWLDTDPAAPLTRRLLAVLLAGDGAGGDSRGRQSAALLVVKDGAGYAGFDDVLADLRVDDHANPVTELGRLLDLHELFFGAAAEEDKVAVDSDLRAELDDLARRTGRADFDAWVGAENFENRVWPDAIDRQVLSILRTQADRG